MEAVMQAILDQLTAAGGSTTYPQILEATPYENRRHLVNALKTLKRSNQVTQKVELVDGAIVHTYSKVEA